MSTPTPATPAVVSGQPEPRPAMGSSFARAVQGIWLLTWKSRLGLRQLPSLIAWVLVIPLLAYFTLPARPEAARAGYFFWTVNFFTMLVVPLYCLSAFGALIRDEIQADTLRFLITRPVKRWVLFALKFVCLVIFIELIVLRACAKINSDFSLGKGCNSNRAGFDV